jgi:hypothetical protein
MERVATRQLALKVCERAACRQAWVPLRMLSDAGGHRPVDMPPALIRALDRQRFAVAGRRLALPLMTAWEEAFTGTTFLAVVPILLRQLALKVCERAACRQAGVPLWMGLDAGGHRPVHVGPALVLALHRCAALPHQCLPLCLPARGLGRCREHRHTHQQKQHQASDSKLHRNLPVEMGRQRVRRGRVGSVALTAGSGVGWWCGTPPARRLVWHAAWCGRRRGRAHARAGLSDPSALPSSLAVGPHCVTVPAYEYDCTALRVRLLSGHAYSCTSLHTAAVHVAIYSS